jgi:hypothetical protein
MKESERMAKCGKWPFLALWGRRCINIQVGGYDAPEACSGARLGHPLKNRGRFSSLPDTFLANFASSFGRRISFIKCIHIYAFYCMDQGARQGGEIDGRLSALGLI